MTVPNDIALCGNRESCPVASHCYYGVMRHRDENAGTYFYVAPPSNCESDSCVKFSPVEESE